MNRILIISALFVGVLGGCASTAPSWAPGGGMPGSVPAPAAEFRAAWIATVANIDWPSSPDLSTLKQQQELRTMMDRAVEIGLNAIVLQVRPTADAFYASPSEPWSYYLTGVQGRAPEPFYDPLAFAIEEAHRRGLELHAWFNPYRVLHPTATDSISALHASKRLPGSVVTYGDLVWFEPGSDEATAQSMSVIMDVVERYDVDGVHLDDYFYPYPVQDEAGDHVEFPDEANWRADSTDGLSRDDWRRRNVDVFIQNLYEGVKARKPWVKVGISPFGIWRPGHPPSVRGFDQYAGLYADAKKWLNEGWIDYWTPQLYWSMDSEGQSYAALLDWWVAENHHDRHIWPGNYTSRVILEGSAWWEPAEIVRQIEHTRRTEGAAGNVHFSMRALMPAAHGMGEAVAAAYDEPALVPASPWLGGQAPAAPALTAERGYVAVRPAGREPVFVWAVHWWDGRNWHFERVPGWQQALRAPAEGIRGVAVRAVSRLGHVSSPATLTF
jgi:uncharacterized lipoprotein YddW (UPF0748 family)